MRRRRKSIFPKLFFIAIFLGLFIGWKYHSYIYTPIDTDSNDQVSFQIHQGESVKEIGQNLEEKDLIRNSDAFYFHVKQKELGPGIIAGRFLLTQAMDVPEIISNLSNPSSAEAVITIQEGLLVRDIDEKLVKLELIQPGEFSSAVKNFDRWSDYSFLTQSKAQNLTYPLEGYIYPDTYFLDPDNFTPDHLIELTLNNFQKKVTDSGLYSSDRNIHETITMASIIENEVFGKEDRHTVSGILWKRIDNNWFLGADITSIYIKNDRNLTASDLASDSPYNTRINHGLPPGPVGNPSIESIVAALNPSDSEYWFYLTTLDTGEVIYGHTNEEHNANRAKYL